MEIIGYYLMDTAGDVFHFLGKQSTKAILKSGLVQQDIKRVEKNKKQMESLAKDWDSAIRQVAKNLHDNVIVPSVPNNYGFISLKFAQEAVKESSEVTLNTVVSLVETILLNLVKAPVISYLTPTSKKVVEVKDKVSQDLPNFDLSLEEKKVSEDIQYNINLDLDPEYFGATLASKVLAIVKKVAEQEKYKDLKDSLVESNLLEDALSKNALKKEFLKEVAHTILITALPGKSADKDIPVAIRQFINWDKLVDLFANAIDDPKIVPCIVRIGELEENLLDLRHGQQQDINEIVNFPGLKPLSEGIQKMGMKEITSFIDEGMMKTPKGQQENAITGLVNKIAKDLVKPTKEARIVIESYFARVLNRLLVSLLSKQEGDTSAEKVNFLFTKLKFALVGLGYELEKVSKKALDEVEFQELLITHKLAVGEIDVFNLSITAKLKLWKTLSAIEHVKTFLKGDLFLQGMLPDQLLKELLPAFAVDIASPQIMFQVAQMAMEETNLVYLTDIVKNLENLENSAVEDQRAVEGLNGLDGVTDMIMGIAQQQINGDVIKNGLGNNLGFMAEFSKWLAKALIPSGQQTTETKEFVETHVKRVLNHLLAGLLKRQSGDTFEKKLNELVIEIKEAVLVFGKKLNPPIDARKFSKLFEKHQGTLDLEYQNVLNQIQEMENGDVYALAKLQARKTFLERFLTENEVNEAPSKEQTQELWITLLQLEKADLIDTFLEKLVPDQLLREILPHFAVGTLRPQMVSFLLNTPYLTDVANNFVDLQAFAHSDQEAVKDIKGFDGLTDFILNIVANRVEGDAIPKALGNHMGLIAEFSKGVAKTLVPKGANSDTKTFLKNHLKLVLNHVLAHFLKGDKDKSSAERLDSFLKHVDKKLRVFSKNLKEVAIEDYNEEDFNSLWEKYNEVLAMENEAVLIEIKMLSKLKLELINLGVENKNEAKNFKERRKYLTKEIESLQSKKLEERNVLLEAFLRKGNVQREDQKIELWKTLLKLKASDLFLENLLPESLLKEILPHFAADMARPQILFQVFSQFDEKMIATIEKSLDSENVYNTILNVLTKTLPEQLEVGNIVGNGLSNELKEVKKVRKALNQMISRVMKQGVTNGLDMIFGNEISLVIRWPLFIVLFPIIAIAHLVLMILIDQLWLKQIDTYLDKNKDFGDLLKGVAGNLPEFLKAVLEEDQKEKEEIAKIALGEKNRANKIKKIKKAKALALRAAARKIVDEFKDIFSTQLTRNFLADLLVAKVKL